MPRGGLSSDPETRRRQEEGLARGRRIAAERRKAGLPTKRTERELEQRVIEGGTRGEPADDDERGSSRGSTKKATRRERRPTAKREPAATVEVEGAAVENEPGLPWFAPLYTGKRNSRLLDELTAEEPDPEG